MESLSPCPHEMGCIAPPHRKSWPDTTAAATTLRAESRDLGIHLSESVVPIFMHYARFCTRLFYEFGQRVRPSKSSFFHHFAGYQ